MNRIVANALAGLILVLAGFGVTTRAGEPVVPDWLTSIRQTKAARPGLDQAFLDLLQHTESTPLPAVFRDPDLLIASYRIRDQQRVERVVLQAYQDPGKDSATHLNPTGIAAERLGSSLVDPTNHFLNLALHRSHALGAPSEVQTLQRALENAASGDLSLLRGQTIEPLHIVAVLTHAGRYLPVSLRDRVHTVVLTGQLEFGEWRGQFHFLSDTADTAEQVGHIVAAWRDMAGTLAETYAGHTSGRRLREALKASTVQVTDSRVISTVAVPANTVVRVAKEAAGHGGGCPAGGVCGKSKVLICHNEPNRGPVAVCVSPSAVASHIAQHGDYCGPCITTLTSVNPPPR
jgi:hypothetical protein